MQQSSGSIGSLAAALARAQVELVNPEKSMVATIRPAGRGAAEQIFRYAPLSDGLNIIHKTLGQHEIATVQSTLVEQTAGLIRLNTVLAHSSGEWISSDWPVCPLAPVCQLFDFLGNTLDALIEPPPSHQAPDRLMLQNNEHRRRY
jgi:hypothetical protein